MKYNNFLVDYLCMICLARNWNVWREGNGMKIIITHNKSFAMSYESIIPLIYSLLLFAMICVTHLNINGWLH